MTVDEHPLITDDPVLALVARANPCPAATVTLDRGAETLLADLLEQPRPAVVRSRRRRRLVIAGVATVGIAGLGAGAAAAGLLPDAVTSRFESVSGSTVTDGHQLAEYVSADGVREQIWRGHTADGQICIEVRTVTGEGTDTAATGCGSPPPITDTTPLVFGLDPAGPPWPTDTGIVSGYVNLPNTGFATLEARYPDGTSYTLTYNPDTKWAIGIVPASERRLSGRVVALTTDGTVIAASRALPQLVS